jgi:hypothetical protein
VGATGWYRGGARVAPTGGKSGRSVPLDVPFWNSGPRMGQAIVSEWDKPSTCTGYSTAPEVVFL